MLLVGIWEAVLLLFISIRSIFCSLCFLSTHVWWYFRNSVCLDIRYAECSCQELYFLFGLAFGIMKLITSYSVLQRVRNACPEIASPVKSKSKIRRAHFSKSVHFEFSTKTILWTWHREYKYVLEKFN